MQANNTPNEITDEILLAYLDGEAQADIVDQIENSPRYLKRLNELAQIHFQLLERLYRLMCPDSTKLGEYHLNLLSNKEARAIKRHVNECPHCAKELLDLERFLGQDGATLGASITEHVKVLVAQLVSGFQNGLADQTPAYALRGDDKGILVYEADGIRVNLDLQEIAESTNHHSVLGLITGLQAYGYSIELNQGGKTIISTQVDEIGNFMLLQVPFGEYELVIRSPELEIRMNVNIRRMLE